MTALPPRAERRRFRPRSGVVIATVAALLAAGFPEAAAAAPVMDGVADSVPAGAPSGPARPGVENGPPPGRYRITLITGDQVELAVAGGTYEASIVDWADLPGRSSTPRYRTFAGPDGVFVIPADAQPAIDTGLLDRTLFDVAYLAANGFTDARTTELPVLVEFRERDRAPLTEATLRAGAAALPAARTTAVLSSIGATGVSVAKSRAAGFWRSVSSSPAGRSGHQIEKIWLDRPVRANLAESVPLIGAPEAWSAGYTGAGVTVAVLDTGIDSTHPDLQGKVVATKSFVGGDSVKDGHGHGTHVASTIAGRGTGGGTRYQGVAPGVRLAVGKVLGDDGGGTIAGIIDGMEWAAEEADADIVSMSLGTDATDGTDPASQALNALTAATGTLFVVAAGNSGPAAGTVGAPGAADAALTVGATDKQDAMAPFSSRGPRADAALKPDITAPGVAIVAARATGTAMGTPVNELYTKANGTSMATPHVAGAAAILAQQHPDWSPAELKAGLMSTSRDAGATVYEQGAGRVDIARAVRQSVLATTAALDFGARPDNDSAPVVRQVEYRNTGKSPVTLTLTPAMRTVAGQPVPAGALAADPTVTVPADGTATATVTLRPEALDRTQYTGALTATDQASGTVLATPIGLTVEPPKVTLTIRTLDRTGKPIGSLPLEQGGDLGGFAASPSTVSALDVPGVDAVDPLQVEPGLERVRVQAGTYSVWRYVSWWDDAVENYVEGMLLDAQVQVTGDTEIVLDARAAKPITWSLPQAGTGPRHTYLSIDVGIWDRRMLHSTGFAHYITPTEKVTAGTFRVGFKREEYTNTQVSMAFKGSRVPIPLEHRNQADGGLTMGEGADGSVNSPGGWTPFPAGRRTLQLVDAGFGDPADLAGLDLRGKLALVRWGDARIPGGLPTSVIHTDRIDNLQRAGAAGFVAFADPPGEQLRRHASFASPTSFFQHWEPAGPKQITIPELQVRRSVGRDLLSRTRRGPVTVEVTGDPQLRFAYHAHVYHRQQVSPNLHFVLSSRDFARVDGRLHSAIDPSRVHLTAASWLPGTVFNTPKKTTVAAPRTAFTEYFGPVNSEVVWTRQLLPAVGQFAPTSAEPRAFASPLRDTEDWNAGVRTPAPVTLRNYNSAAHPAPGGIDLNSKFVGCTLCRQGNSLLPWLGTVDGDGHFTETLSSDVKVYDAGGTQIPLTERTGLPVWNLPATAARYSATLDKDGVSTRWTFQSAPPSRSTVPPDTFCLGLLGGWPEPCAAQPLVYLSYDLGDRQKLDNTLPATPVQRFRVRASTGSSTVPMPAIAGMKLWTSVDGGKHWRPAVTIPRSGSHGDRWYDVVALAGGRPGATLTLKAEAWDTAGNRIEQLVKSGLKLS